MSSLPPSDIFQEITSPVRCWLAEHPKGTPVKGILQFYGGAFFELAAPIWYEYLLGKLYLAGYDIIAVPFKFGMDHIDIALSLIEVRDFVVKEREAFNKSYFDKETPFIWLGHSVGCKIIALLEVLTNTQTETYIAYEPSLLLAPNIEDTSSTVPIPLMGKLLDLLGLGVKPNKETMETLIHQRPDVFEMTGLISFAADNVSGNQAGTVAGKTDVKWFVQELSTNPHRSPEARAAFKDRHPELPGDHYTPIGLELGGEIGGTGAAGLPVPVLTERQAKELQANLDRLVAESLRLLESLGDKYRHVEKTVRANKAVVL